MAAYDSTRAKAESPARMKATKARALTLRPHEARKLDQDGRVLIVREIKPQPPALCRYEMNEARTAALCLFDAPERPGGIGFCPPTGMSKGHRLLCPLGPVGSPLWGREAWSPDHAAFYPNFPHVYKAYGHPAAWEIEGGRIYSDEAKDWFPFRWRSSTSMPRHASRFPRLRHESCEVKRSDSLTWDDVAAMGLPDGPDRIVKPGSVPIEYIEIKPVDMVTEFHGIAAELWCWCSLVVDLDRLEAADA